MAITKIQSESLNLSDNYDFTGTVTGAGESNVPYCQAYLSASQSVSSNTTTVIQFNTTTYDSSSDFDTSNYRYVPSVAGKYLIQINMYNFGANYSQYFYIRKNGTSIKEVHIDQSSTTNNPDHRFFSVLTEANGSSDYFDVTVYFENSTRTIAHASNGTLFTAFKLTD